MPNYANLIKTLKHCKPDIWDETVNFHKDGKYSFIGIAAMLSQGIVPSKDAYKSLMKQGIFLTTDHAKNWLDLNLFEFSLFWNYYDSLTIRELNELILYVCTGKPFNKDGLLLTKQDLCDHRILQKSS